MLKTGTISCIAAICRPASGLVDCVAGPNRDLTRRGASSPRVLTTSGGVSDNLSLGQMSAELVEITYRVAAGQRETLFIFS